MEDMMDLNEEQANELFGDDRERDIDAVELSHWLSIHRDGEGVIIETREDEYELSKSDVEEMKDEYGWDSIWRAISERHKCLSYILTNDE